MKIINDNIKSMATNVLITIILTISQNQISFPKMIFLYLYFLEYKYLKASNTVSRHTFSTLFLFALFKIFKIRFSIFSRSFFSFDTYLSGASPICLLSIFSRKKEYSLYVSLHGFDLSIGTTEITRHWYLFLILL